jgi:hypothetical protein
MARASGAAYRSSKLIDSVRVDGSVRIGSWVSVVGLTLSIAFTGAAAQAADAG